MKGKDLFAGMSGIGADLIDEAEFAAFPAKRRSARTMILAALVAAAILMMGCAAVYLLRLQDMQVGERIVSREVYDATGQMQGYQDVTEMVLSLSGLKGSTNFLATEEWFTFKNELDPNNDLANAYYSDPNPEVFPEAYDAYQPYTWEMVSKLDELAEKYNLKLLGALEQYQYENDFLAGTGIASILCPDAPVKLNYQNGHRYAGGNFGFVFELEPLDSSQDWPSLIWGTCRCNKTGYLSPDTIAINAEEAGSERIYTTASGENVLVVTLPSSYAAVVFCIREDAIIQLTISSLQKPIGDVISQELTQEQLEAIIDSFDFSIS